MLNNELKNHEMKGLQESEMGIKRSRKLCKADLKAIAELIGEQNLTEKQACLIIGIDPKRFANWKVSHKHEPEFNDLIECVRGATLKSNMGLIKASALGEGMKQRDWRAAAWINERLAPAQYAQLPQSASQTTNVITLNIAESIRRAYDGIKTDLICLDMKSCHYSVPTQIKAISAPANSIPETRKLPPKRKGEIR